MYHKGLCAVHKMPHGCSHEVVNYSGVVQYIMDGQTWDTRDKGQSEQLQYCRETFYDKGQSEQLLYYNSTGVLL